MRRFGIFLVPVVVMMVLAALLGHWLRPGCEAGLAALTTALISAVLRAPGTAAWGYRVGVV